VEHAEAQLTALLNVILAGLLAAVPGLDRQLRNRPAGLRTHMIVGMSSTLIVAMARILFVPDSSARMITGVITGIGFLGAGVIIQHKRTVHDLTTAASIWMVAMLGIVVAYEMYILAIGATLVLGFVLTILRRFEKRVSKPQLTTNSDES
jgi:putative Mg2+ transporter-C (MgtC) family protein